MPAVTAQARTGRAGEVLNPAPALLAALTLLATATAPARADAQSSDWFVGAGVSAAGVPSPFVARCDPYGRHANRGLVGIGPRVGRIVAPGTAIVLAVAHHANPGLASGPVCIGIARGTGYEYPPEVDGGSTQSIELGIVKSADLRVIDPPARIPLRGSVAVGRLRGTPAPYAAATLGLRFGARVRTTIDAGIRVATVPRVLVEAERVDEYTVILREGRRHRVPGAGFDLRLGIEVPLRR